MCLIDLVKKIVKVRKGETSERTGVLSAPTTGLITPPCHNNNKEGQLKKI
jgi:hypothetical protein